MGKSPSDSVHEESTTEQQNSYVATTTFEPINPANDGPVISASKKPDSDDDSLE